MTKNRFYAFIRALAIPFVRLIYPFRLTGAENVPAEGPVVLCSNHRSNLDPLFLAIGIKHRELHFMCKKELFKTKLTAAFFTKLGMFAVDRGHTDMSAMRNAMSLIREGRVFAIFPQGHRYKLDDHRELLSGATLIAMRSGAKIVPIHIGSVKPFRRTDVNIGEAFDLSSIRRPDEATKLLTEAIWKE